MQFRQKDEALDRLQAEHQEILAKICELEGKEFKPHTGPCYFLNRSSAQANIDRARARLSELEELKSLRALVASSKEKREALARGPVNSAKPPPLPTSHRPAISEAAKALLEAERAKAAAKVAQEKAKAAVAAVPVLGNGKQEGRPRPPSNLTMLERRAWNKAHDVFSQSTAKYCADGHLMQLATNPNGDAADRPIAVAELRRRGWTYNAEAKVWSQKLK